jgi:hypothetical protein
MKENQTDISMDVNSSVELDEKLTPQQRIKKARTMRRISARLAMGRRKAAKRMPTREKIEQKAAKLARKRVAEKILSRMNKTADELSYKEKDRLEELLKKRKGLIDRLKVKMIPIIRKKEIEKFSNKNEELSFKSFKNYYAEELKELNKKIYVYFGPFNPPSKYHREIFDFLSNFSQKNGDEYRIYSFINGNDTKNPLSYNEKIKFTRKMFPKHSRNIIYDPTVENVFSLLSSLYEEGFNEVTLVTTGESEINPDLIQKMNGESEENKYGFYHFDSPIDFIQLDSSDLKNKLYTSNQMIKFASENDFGSFISGLPSNFSEKKELFNSVRSGLGLKESTNFRGKVKLELNSPQKENKYKVGDKVKLISTNEVYKVCSLGANYLVIENALDKSKKKVWIKEVELKKDEDDPCWDGYVSLGTKMKNGKKVPNCVPLKV